MKGKRVKAFVCSWEYDALFLQFQSPQAGPENIWSAAAPLAHKDTPQTRKGQGRMQ
jgi:hypothetical protein